MRLQRHTKANDWETLIDNGSLTFVTIEPGRLIIEIVGVDAAGKKSAFRLGMDSEEAARIAHKLALFSPDQPKAAPKPKPTPQKPYKPTDIVKTVLTKALLDAEMVNGIPARSATKNDALAEARNDEDKSAHHGQRSRWLRLLCDRLPDSRMTIGDCWTDQEAAQAWQLAGNAK